MNNAAEPRTNIEIPATQQDVARILAAQYSHLSPDEAKTALSKTHGQVWTNEELLDTFELSHFDPPYAHVIRKADAKRGTVIFIDSPRLYFSFHTEQHHNA